MSAFDPVVGLFGTCGKSTWRERFITELSAKGISFYNPQVANWTPECAETEAQHLVEDDIVLFPVTAETTGFGSLAETGYSILQTVKFMQDNARPRLLIVFIDKNCDWENPTERKASLNTRALVKAHLRRFKQTTVIEVNSLDEMMVKTLQGVELLKAWNVWAS